MPTKSSPNFPDAPPDRSWTQLSPSSKSMLGVGSGTAMVLASRYPGLDVLMYLSPIATVMISSIWSNPQLDLPSFFHEWRRKKIISNRIADISQELELLNSLLNLLRNLDSDDSELKRVIKELKRAIRELETLIKEEIIRLRDGLNDY